MDTSQALQDFFARRSYLLGLLETSGEQVTRWYEERRAAEPTLQQLAILEGLLAERRRLLERLMKLDDDMLDQLVRIRGSRGNDPVR